MEMNKLNSGLVYTNEECIGCNHCISACPVLEANCSLAENGKDLIYVNGDACVHCGACIDACHHHARDYRDDTEQFLEDLKKGNPSAFWLRLRLLQITQRIMGKCWGT